MNAWGRKLIFLTGLLCALILPAAASAASCDAYCNQTSSTSPWGYWRLEDDTLTVADETGAGNNATRYVSSSNLVPGVMPGTYGWGPTTNFRSGYPGDGQTFTVQHWVKIDSSRFSTGSVNYAGRSMAAGSLATAFRNTADPGDWGDIWVENPAAGWTWRSTGRPFADDQWHMLTVGHDKASTTAKVWLDGTPVFTKTDDDYEGNVLGQHILWGDLGNIRMVSIDEAAVWPRLLADGEVQAMYAARGAAAAQNTAAPQVTGTAAQNQSLTADQGTWTNITPPAAYRYQWQCDKGNGVFTNISGATSSTLPLADAQVGCRVRVRVILTDATGASGTAYSAATSPVTGIAPANTVTPALSSVAQDLTPITVSTGTWTGTQPISFSYQWQRQASPGVWTTISGATGAAYTPTGADIGLQLRAQVTAVNAAGTQSTVTSASSNVVAAVPVNRTRPPLTVTQNSFREGETVTAGPGAWTGSTPISYSYQWQRCTPGASGTCTDIPAATTASYTLTAADVGQVVRANVTASNSSLPGGGATSITSVSSAQVTPAAPVSTAAPSVSGAAQDTQTLTAATGAWSGVGPITYSYQWQRCDTMGSACANIPAATGASYTVQSADITGTLRVVVRAANAGGPTNATSAATAPVTALPPANTTAPQINGAANAGVTLGVSNGIWAGSNPKAYTYAWERETSPGVWTAQAGQTQNTYQLSTADIGARIRARVTASNATLPGGGAVQATTTPTVTVTAVAPQNTAAPAVTGTAMDGRTLTATTGTWTGTAPISYGHQWQKETSPGGWADIPSATASTYTLTGTDVGSRVRVTVTADNTVWAGGAAVSQPSAATATVIPIPPQNTVRPSLSGDERDTRTLTVADGVWTGTPPIAYSYQWQRCNNLGGACVNIAGATAATYTLTAANIGGTVKAGVTATNVTGTSTIYTAASGIVQALAPANLTVPPVTGTETDGQTLTAGAGTWEGSAPLSFSYQWERETAPGAWTAVPGATASTFTLTSADVAARLRVTVTARNHTLPGGGIAHATSLPTGTVQARPPAATAAPTLTGAAVDGLTVTSSNGTWTGSTPMTYTYQWQKETSPGVWTDITGATASAYTVQSADIGQRLRSSVTASNASLPGGATATQASLPTSPVTPTPPVNTVLPSLTGTATAAMVLTAADGTWTGSAPIAYSYQWLRCNAAGSACSTVTGATAATYILTDSDIGSRLRIRVTATNPGGPTAATSAPSDPVQALRPANITAPPVTGTSTAGQTLTAATGGWVGSAPITYTYQWQTETAPGVWDAITGATASTFTLRHADVGARVRVEVTASNAALLGGGSSSAASDPTGPVQAMLPTINVIPAVTGTVRDGLTVATSTGSWNGTPPMTYTYAWQRETAPGVWTTIPGETAATYTATVSDLGLRLRSVVTASNAGLPGGGTVSTVSNPTAAVAPAPPVNTALPAIAGPETDGQTLTATTGAWTGSPTITYAYQWERCDSAGAACAPIGAATASSYTLQSADAGRTVRVRVSATNAAATVPAYSPASGIIQATVPVNLTVPGISGTLQDSRTVTVTPSSWAGSTPMTFTYQWQRETSPGVWTDIPGQTASSYTLTSADVTRSVRVTVTASNAFLPGGGSASVTSTPAGIVQALPPAATVPPAITGTSVDGGLLSTSNGTWAGSTPMSFAYQWQVEASPGVWTDIPGQTAAAYAPVSADVGRRLRTVVTADNTSLPGGAQNTTTSTPSAPVSAAAPANTTAPQIAGTALHGQTLTVTSDGTWAGTQPISFTYQWQREISPGVWTNIAGQTAVSYVLQDADAGRRVRVSVTGSNTVLYGGTTSAAQSAPSAVVQAIPPANSALPQITGTEQDTRTLTADPGTWTGTQPMSTTYQWQRCNAFGGGCVNIAGATAATYTAAPADVSQTLRVIVTRSNAGLPSGGTATATSPVSGLIQALPPCNTALPTVTPANPAPGQTLTAAPGSWCGTPTLNFTYQWQVETAAGSGAYQNIFLAMGQTYTTPAKFGAFPSSYNGRRIRVQVTASNAFQLGGGTATATSTPTAPISG